MTFKSRNAYYLRISTDVVLPLFLYLDERHIDWMSDIVLQHVLAVLRPLIIPKLQAEKDIHFGPGAVSGDKRGTVQVHRGETYQFAYFFRKTEPHTVLLKSRYFVTAPVSSEVAPKPASSRLPNQSPKKKRLRTQVSVRQSKRKRVSTSKGKNSRNHLGEDEWPAEHSECDMDGADFILREPRPVRKQRHVMADAYREDDDDDGEDVAMSSPPPERDGRPSRDSDASVVNDGGTVSSEENDQSRVSPEAGIELVVEEEEEKPKPLLKLKYRSFSITGHCLCVVVEPWPPLHMETGLQSRGVETAFQHGSLGLSLQSSEPVTVGQRAKTPLFFPEYDRAPSEAPFARERTLPPVPLFHEAVRRAEDGEHSGDDDLMNFSQMLNAAGHMHALAADDDDDMDGAVLFGDADEVRELF